MNKEKFVNELIKKTNYSEEQCKKIIEIFDNYFQTRKIKKNNILNDLINMGFNFDESNNIYNIFKSILQSRLKNKVKNPFSYKN